VIGAAFGGAIGCCATSGPGLALKSEGIALAVVAELPLVVFDIQRGGPSTGLPTKTEQADLLQALYGRNSECPVVVLAPATPGDCFFIAYEAIRIAVKYMVPVIVLSDGYLANGAEPWPIPDPATLPPIDVHFRTEKEGFFPYLREEATLARPWVRPGTPGLEHRIGGLEKQHITGNVSYDPDNHDLMVRLRAEKVRRVAQEIPPTTINGPAGGGQPRGDRAVGRSPADEEEVAFRISGGDDVRHVLHDGRDPETLARPWAIPGTPGLEHRIGGLEKQDITGNVNYEAENHDLMTKLRFEKIERIANDIPDVEVFGDEEGGDVLVLGWGSTYGVNRTAVQRARAAGKSVSQAHLRYLNPMPKNLGDVLKRFKKVLVPENNMGQLLLLVRAEYLVDAVGLHRITGRPFTISEVEDKILEMAD
jgi:pyruvate/2-oxoacid:ferredoxin oxidoreductase alpha subunit